MHAPSIARARALASASVSRGICGGAGAGQRAGEGRSASTAGVGRLPPAANRAACLRRRFRARPLLGQQRGLLLLNAAAWHCLPHQALAALPRRGRCKAPAHAARCTLRLRARTHAKRRPLALRRVPPPQRRTKVGMRASIEERSRRPLAARQRRRQRSPRSSDHQSAWTGAPGALGRPAVRLLAASHH